MSVVGTPRAAAAPRRRLRSGPWTFEAAALAVVVAVLLLIGLLMSFSASFVDAAEGGDPFATFRRQLAWGALGGAAFIGAAALDHRVWRVVSWPLLVTAVAGLVAVLLPGVGLMEGGSRRWLPLGPFAVQPSEVAKLATLLWLADVLTRKRECGIVLEERLSHLLVPAVPLLLVEGTLVMLEPDLGTTLLLGLAVALVIAAEGAPLRVLAALGAAGAGAAGVLAVVEPYRFARLTGWLHPEADPLGSGYQLLQSLYALGSGGWFGVGLGSSRAKWNYVPNPETDFIFAIIGEELGLVGGLAVLALFCAVLVLGLRIATAAPDGFGRTCAVAITGWVVGQAIVNVAAATGLLPITGIPLPLVSVGGSSLVSTLAALGILVSVGRAGGARTGRAGGARTGRAGGARTGRAGGARTDRAGGARTGPAGEGRAS